MDLLHFMTDAERVELREYVARGTLPKSQWLGAALDCDPRASALDERAPVAVAIFFGVLPFECWGSPMNVARWHRAGGTRGERAPALN